MRHQPKLWVRAVLIRHSKGAPWMLNSVQREEDAPKHCGVLVEMFGEKNVRIKRVEVKP